MIPLQFLFLTHQHNMTDTCMRSIIHNCCSCINLCCNSQIQKEIPAFPNHSCLSTLSLFKILNPFSLTVESQFPHPFMIYFIRWNQDGPTSGKFSQNHRRHKTPLIGPWLFSTLSSHFHETFKIKSTCIAACNTMMVQWNYRGSIIGYSASNKHNIKKH